MFRVSLGSVGLLFLALILTGVLPFRPAIGSASAIGVVLIVVYLCLRPFRWLSRLAVEVSGYPLQAGACHEIEIRHADQPLRDVRLRLVSVEERRRGRRVTTRVGVPLPVVLTPPDDPGGAWKGRLEVPRSAVLFAGQRLSVTWRLEVRLRRWLTWIARYPVKIQGTAAAKPVTRLEGDDLTVWLDGDQPVLAPGGVLTGGFEAHPREGTDRLQRVELSVLWVLGPGNQLWGRKELHVCHFEEYKAAGDDDAALRGPRPFRVVLPDGPPGFSGQLFQVGRAVRVRLHFQSGKEVVRNLPFQVLPRGGAPTVGSCA
jgi:hypothetical protein